MSSGPSSLLLARLPEGRLWLEPDGIPSGSDDSCSMIRKDSQRPGGRLLQPPGSFASDALGTQLIFQPGSIFCMAFKNLKVLQRVSMDFFQ